MWNKIKSKWGVIRKHGLWFYVSEGWRYYYNRYKGNTSIMINIKTGRAIYEDEVTVNKLIYREKKFKKKWLTGDCNIKTQKKVDYTDYLNKCCKEKYGK
jgi:hypothetical protein